MPHFIYNPATGYWELEGYLEQFVGDVPNDALYTDAAQHHALLGMRVLKTPGSPYPGVVMDTAPDGGLSED